MNNRIPRPKGTTNLARNGLTKELISSIMLHYLDGSFPYRGYTVSPLELSQLYNIPLQTVQRYIRQGLAENLFDSGDNILGQLTEARSQALSQVLGRIGDSDLRLNQILRHLAVQVLDNPSAHPLLVKEFNSSIANQTRLSETQLKAVAQIQSFLDAIPQDIRSLDNEPELSREAILEHLYSIEASPASLAHYLKDIPSLKPIGVQEDGEKVSLNRKASHEFVALKDQKKLPIKANITVGPR